VAAYLAESKKEHRNPLILDSTFTSLKDVAAFHAPLLRPVTSWILGDAYDTRRRLGEIKASHLLVLHSPDDEVVPFEQGKRNFDEYQGGPKTMIVVRGKHMDYLINQGDYYVAIRDIFGLAAQRSGEADDQPASSGGEADDQPTSQSDGADDQPASSGGEAD
jgi:hypothetical protein